MSSLTQELRADSRLAQRHHRRLISAPFNLIVVVLYRLGSRIHEAGFVYLALPFQWTIQLLTGADIHMAARLGPGLFLHHTSGVVIGPGVVADGDLTLYGTVALGLRKKTGRGWGYPTIGQNVEIFAKASVLGPVSIGTDAKIGAHALVLDDVPAGASVRGPAPSVIATP